MSIKNELEYQFANYNVEKYTYDLKSKGLEKTWDQICDYLKNCDNFNEFLNINNLGELYEFGLAFNDKMQKKNSGQYYTPSDVAELMASWLKECDGINICDVACGTGKLILTYFKLIGDKKTKEILNEGRLYLYDLDKTALKICKTSILIKYGKEYNDKIHDICDDFLRSEIKLPIDSKVISNPPYASIKEIIPEWGIMEVAKDTKELYSSFMDKIISQSKSSVIITPYSFVSGTKFKTLRRNMCNNGTGKIVVFDNVPGNIFCGRKHGVFNTNTANSVRAAITVSKKSTEKGYKITEMIRFKNEERTSLLSTKTLNKEFSNMNQIADEMGFKKISNRLFLIYEKWISNSQFTLKDFNQKEECKYLIDMPNTCRYNTTGSSKKLNRNGSIKINIDDEDIFDFLYCFINSSFTYWWWRIYDGGITYSQNLLNKLPLPYNKLSVEDKDFFKKIAREMIKNEEKYRVIKINAGAPQENIKFPEKYRQIINKKILEIIGINDEQDVFRRLHANRFFIEGEEEKNE